MLLPLAKKDTERESIVLRPIHSVDAMTASPFLIDRVVLQKMAGQILATNRFSAVFYDLTSKPPGTIEWE